ncbi:MAG: hypothetical protein AB7G87_07715 [Clostridia bacterium]
MGVNHSELLIKVHRLYLIKEKEVLFLLIKKYQTILSSDDRTTVCMTYDKLAALEPDLFEHIHLENNIWFARLEQ